MKNSVTHDVGMVGAGISGTSGLMLWLGENASAIGALVAVLSLLVTTLFLTLNYLANRKSQSIDINKLKREIMESLKDE